MTHDEIRNKTILIFTHVFKLIELDADKPTTGAEATKDAAAKTLVEGISFAAEDLVGQFLVDQNRIADALECIAINIERMNTGQGRS